MTGWLVEIKYFWFSPQIVGKDGKIMLSSALFISRPPCWSPLVGGTRTYCSWFRPPHHMWWVDEDPFSHLPVQAGVEGSFNSEWEGCSIIQPLYVFYLKMFCECILAVVCFYAGLVFIYTMISVVSCLPVVDYLQSILPPPHSYRGGSLAGGTQRGQSSRADSSVTFLQSPQLRRWHWGASLHCPPPPGSYWPVLSLGWGGRRRRSPLGDTRMSGPATSSVSGQFCPSICLCIGEFSQRLRQRTGPRSL